MYNRSDIYMYVYVNIVPVSSAICEGQHAACQRCPQVSWSGDEHVSQWLCCGGHSGGLGTVPETDPKL